MSVPVLYMFTQTSSLAIGFEGLINLEITCPVKKKHQDIGFEFIGAIGDIGGPLGYFNV